MRFTMVFAELERAYNFERARPERWPDLATMKRAALELQRRREQALADPTRHARVRAYAASVPRVGYWGWRARRDAAR